MKTTKQIAKKYGVSLIWVQKWAVKYGVKKVGRDFVFTKEDEKRFSRREKRNE